MNIAMMTGMTPRVVLSALAALTLSSCADRTVLIGSGSDVPRLKIWFVKAEGENLTLVPVLRRQLRKDKLPEAVTELLSGPSEEECRAGLKSEIPRGTILLGIEHRGGDLELDVSQRFASGGGASSMAVRLEQLRRTVADAAGVKKVYLSVEGRRLTTAAGEGLEVEQPLN